jgi:membrane protease YdiL (CAAX protease family)
MVRQRAFPSIDAPVTVIMLFQVAALFGRSFLQGELTDRGFEREFARNLSYLVVPLLELLLLWPILRANRLSLHRLFRIPAAWPALLLRAAFLGLLARLCGWSVLIASTAFGWFDYAQPGTGNGPEFWFACPPPGALLLGLVVTVVLIPVGEEIINRGLIFGSMRTCNRNYAIFVSAGLFAILHSPQAMAAAFGMGILLAIQTDRSGSLWPAIVTHATYNFLRVVDWYCLYGIWNPEALSNTTVAVGTAAIAVGLVAFVLAIRLLAHTGSGQVTHPDPAA